MSKFERFFYFFIILVQLTLIILLSVRLGDCTEKITSADRTAPEQNRGLYSFPGITAEGNREWVHFSAYSPVYRLLVTFSSQCPHCGSLIGHLQKFFADREINDGFQVYLITTDVLPPVDIGTNPGIKWLRIAYDDSVQLGGDTPSIFAVDGRGEILYKRKGYFPGFINKVYQAIEMHKNKNRQSRTLN